MEKSALLKAARQREEYDYMRTIKKQTIPDRAQVLEWGRQMGVARSSFRREVFRLREVLVQCSEFLGRFANKEFRWDYSFNVCQKDSDRIEEIRHQLPYAMGRLNCELRNLSPAPLSEGHEVVSIVDELDFRTLRIVEWYKKAKGICTGRNECYFRNADVFYRHYIEAKQKLASSCLLLVVKIANEYRSPSRPLMELIQNGNIGLMKAAEKFDYSKGFTFTAYSSHWIRQCINVGIQQSNMIHLPVQQVNRIRKCKKQLEERRQSSLTKLCAAETQSVITSNRLKEATFIAFRDQVVSLEQLRSRECESPIDIAEPQTGLRGEQKDLLNLQGELASAFDALDERQRIVLELRYGLNGNKAHTLTRIAKRIGLTHQRAQQIQAESLKRLEVALTNSNSC